jgi:hypothetical protein
MRDRRWLYAAYFCFGGKHTLLDRRENESSKPNLKAKLFLAGILPGRAK